MFPFLLAILLITHTPAPAQPVIKHYVQVADSEIYVEESGKGDALMLLHAGNMDHRMWAGQVGAFNKQHTVFNIDLRGCGLTRDGDSTYLQSDALLAIMNALKIRKASFIGISLGAVVATAFALAHPDKVHKLVLASPGLIGIDLNHDSALVRYGRQMEAADKLHHTADYTELFIKAWVDGPLRTPAQVDSAVRNKAFAIAYENISKRKPGVHLGFVYQPTQWQQLSMLHKPVLVIAGAKDMKDILLIAEAYRNNGAQVIMFPSAAHMVNMEQPEAFNQRVLGFL